MAELTHTISESADLLGISKDLAYDMARTGKLPAIRLGRRLVVPKAALARMMEAGQ